MGEIVICHFSSHFLGWPVVPWFSVSSHSYHL